MKQFLLDYGELIAVFLSPVFVVIVTIFYQNRKEKLKAKQDLFLTLMAKRKSYPPPIEFVDALNKIDVVFQHDRKVRIASRAFVDSLTPQGIQTGLSNSYLLDMLSEMAESLGYTHLRQTEIDKFYTPQYYNNQTINQEVFWQEYIRVLDHSKNLGTGFSKKEMKKRRKMQNKAAQNN